MRRSSVALGLLALAALGPSCAHVPAAWDRPQAKSADDWLAKVEWSAAATELVAVTQGYVRIDTSNPPGNEAEAAHYLAQVLAREGITSELIELSPGRSSLVARLEGRERGRALCLLSHLDVVPAHEADWAHAPFSGDVDEAGFLWGRGALDMKGLGAIEALTLVWLERLGVPLARDVVLIAVADEEVANRGVQQVLAERAESLGCEVALNEGGVGITDLLFPGQTVFAISVAEKGALWFELVARGEAGHGSTPVETSAPRRLVEAIARLVAYEAEPELRPAMFELLARAGAARGGLSGFVMQRPTLVDWFVVEELMASPPTRAAITHTFNLTDLDTPSENVNVVPSEARARIDGRLLPGTKPEAQLALVRSIVGPDIEVRVLLAEESIESALDHPFLAALAGRLVEGREGAVSGPVVAPGSSDAVYLRARGIQVYGVLPFAIARDDLKRIHGANERVAVSELARGLRAVLGATLEVAAQP